MGNAASAENGGSSIMIGADDTAPSSKGANLDKELGYYRPALKKGASLTYRMEKLQEQLDSNKKKVEEIVDHDGLRAKLDMGVQNLEKSRKAMQALRTSGMDGSMEFRQKELAYKKEKINVEKLKKQIHQTEMRAKLVERKNKKDQLKGRMGKNKVAPSRPGGKPRGSKAAAEPQLLTMPTWRKNVEHAKTKFKTNFRTFAVLNHAAHSTYASGEKYGTYMHLEDLKSQGIVVYTSLGDRADDFVQNHKVFLKKEAQEAKEKLRAKQLPPLDRVKSVGQVLVGPHWLWRKDRVPLCTPVLVLSKNKDGSMSGPAVTFMEPSSEEFKELEDVEKLETWCKDHDSKDKSMATLQDIGNTLQMMLNRNNSRFVESGALSVPTILDIAAYNHAGGVELDAYKEEVKTMIQEGRFAVQIHATESAVKYPDDTTAPLWQLEPWEVMEQAAPGQIPACERLSGLSFMRRVAIRLNLAIKTIAGHPGLQATTVIFHVRESDFDTTMDELDGNAYFGFSRERVHVIKAKEEHGFTWDDELRMFTVDENSPRTTGGDGFSMQQLLAPYESYMMAPGGKVIQKKTTMMSMLIERKVQWMHSFHINDLQALSRGGTIDPVGLALAIKQQKTHGANMATEINEVKTMTEMQFWGSVLLRKAGGENSKMASLHKVHEVLSPPLIAEIERLRKRSGGKLMVGTNRYYFYIPKLATILQDKTLWKVTMEMAGSAIYPRRFIQDLTAAKDSYNVAIRSRNKMAHTVAQPEWWAKDIFPVLRQMDQEPAVRAAVGTYLKDMSSALQPAEEPGDRYQQYKKKYGNKPRIICFFVTDNQASRKAFDLVASILQSTISSKDHWHIITSVRSSHNEEAAMDMLDTFADETLGGLNTTRKVLCRGEQKLHDVMQDYAMSVKATLLVFGSTALSSNQGTRRLGSITLTALKSFTTPILVVKDDTRRTDLRRYLSNPKSKIRAVVHVTPTSKNLVEYVGQTLMDFKHRNDIMVLARPDAIDERKRGEKTSSKFVLDHFTNIVRDMELHPVCKPLLGYPQESLPLCADGVEAHFLAVQAPNNRSLPEWICKVLHSTRCAVLVYKDNSVLL